MPKNLPALSVHYWKTSPFLHPMPSYERRGAENAEGRRAYLVLCVLCASALEWNCHTIDALLRLHLFDLTTKPSIIAICTLGDHKASNIPASERLHPFVSFVSFVASASSLSKMKRIQ